MRGVSQKLLADVKKNITPCDEAYALEFRGENFPLRTPTMGTDSVQDIVGRVDGCTTLEVWPIEPEWRLMVLPDGI